MSKCRCILNLVNKSILTESNTNKCKFVSKISFYSVAKGRETGMFNSWPECETQIKGYIGAESKKFSTEQEERLFIVSNTATNKPKKRPRKATSRNKCTGTISSSSTNDTKDKPKETINLDNEHFNSDNNKELLIVMDILEKNNVINKSKKTNKKKKIILLDQLPESLSGLNRSSEVIPNGNCKKTKTTSFSNNASGSYDFMLDNLGYVEVYTDGACLGNGKSSAKAGLGVYFGENHPLNVSEPVSGRATNNCGEIQAATKAIRIAHSNGVNKLTIMTDSKFLINAVTKWMSGWKQKGWKKTSGQPLKNEIDFKDLDNAIGLLDLKWVYVEAHCGIPGNEKADQLAKLGATQYNVIC